MAARILDGKAVAAKIRSRAAEQAAELRRRGVEPCLAVILVGGDPASRIYVSHKEKDCKEAGIRSEEIALPETTSQAELLARIDSLNRRPDVDGILVQLPLPDGIDERAVIEAIDPRKDVDAFHPSNVGRILIGDAVFLPCTPAGVMELLDDAGIEIAGKNCVVVGRSNIVGKPMAMLLLHRNGTVTICHSKTRELAEITRRADILVAAVGRPRFVTADMVKDGAVVVDVGMNRLPDGRLAGDVDYAAVSQKAAWITPVPGGVGPMTRAMLLQNTLKAAGRRVKKD